MLVRIFIYQIFIHLFLSQEFLSAFREQTFVAAKRLSSVKQSEHDTDSDLVGLDARIPGGRFDSNLSDSVTNQESFYHTTRLV